MVLPAAITYRKASAVNVLKGKGENEMNRTSIFQRLARYYPIWLELVLIAFVIFSFWYPAANYAALPDRIPTHFGFSGLPDAWGTKSLANYYLSSLASAFTYLSMTGFVLWAAAVSEPKKLINLSQKQLEEMSPERAEGIRRVVIRGIFVLKGATVGMLAYIPYRSILVAMGEAKGLGWPVNALLGVIMFAAIYMTVRINRLCRIR